MWGIGTNFSLRYFCDIASRCRQIGTFGGFSTDLEKFSFITQPWRTTCISKHKTPKLLVKKVKALFNFIFVT